MMIYRLEKKNKQTKYVRRNSKAKICKLYISIDKNMKI